ncbi:MAG TPA: hypothetical protein VGP80_17225 [Gemmatimonadales bacterium]|nr:hypothetical protein [Gemmatimonadales bacterium]
MRPHPETTYRNHGGGTGGNAVAYGGWAACQGSVGVASGVDAAAGSGDLAVTVGLSKIPRDPTRTSART